jgi:predicted lipoprotein
VVGLTDPATLAVEESPSGGQSGADSTELTDDPGRAEEVTGTTDEVPLAALELEPDGSVVATELESDGGVVEVVLEPDGSVVATELESDGGVVEVVLEPDGSVVEVELEPEGSVVAAELDPDGEVVAVELGPEDQQDSDEQPDGLADAPVTDDPVVGEEPRESVNQR